MRVFRLSDSYELRVAGEGPTSLVAELWHVRRNASGGSVSTRLGHVAAAPHPAEPEAAAHWRADLLLRSDDVAHGLLDSALPEVVADWLLRESAVGEPLRLHVHRGRNTDYVQRGEIESDG